LIGAGCLDFAYGMNLERGEGVDMRKIAVFRARVAVLRHESCVGSAACRRVAGSLRTVSGPVGTEQLREIQAPLKLRYADEPDAALITLEADGELGEGVSCSVRTGKALVEAGLHPGTGGDGSLACSGDMLLEALVACAGVTMRAVATSMGIAVAGSVHAEGDLDWRGTLAVEREAPVGFTAIRLRFALESDASEDELDTLLRLTERYCVVFQTLAGSPTLSVSYTNT
jgi:uncharacterized OsmC-like protein